MTIILFSLFFLTVSSLLPNCAYEANSKCLSCYYGFQLVSGRCDKCSTGFIMMNDVCISQGIFQQQQALQQQILASKNSNTSANIQQNQTAPQFSNKTSDLQSKSIQVNQGSNTLKTPSQNSSNSILQNPSTPLITSPSLYMPNFDIENSGVMYLLNLFGLASKIPQNCFSFTPDFKCVKCGNGYNLSNGSCASQVTTPTNIFGSTSNSGKVGIFGSTTNSQPSNPNSGSNFNSSPDSNISSLGTQPLRLATNSDPNCQMPNSDGFCSQCYFRFYYSNQVRKCVPVNPQCSTWNNLGFCLSCYKGYKLSGTVCLIDNPTSTNSQSNFQPNSVNRIGFQSGQQEPSGQNSQPSSSSIKSGTSSPGNLILMNSDPNCRLMGFNGICSECDNSYVVNSLTGVCSPVNPLCQTWDNIGNCLSCLTGYILSGTTCLAGSMGPASNPGSSTPSSSTSNGVISGNLMGSDPNCRVANSNGSCSQCYNSFYYDQISTKRCVTVNPLCKTWNKLGHCLSCYQGYNLFNNSCLIQNSLQSILNVGTNDLPSTNQDPYCNTYKNGICEKCAPKTYFDTVSRRCSQVDTNCKLWTDSGICTACYDGYFIFNQRQCRLIYPEMKSVQLKSWLNSDVNCRASDSNGVCTQCIWRYVIGPSKVCIKVSDLCKKWNQTTAWCTECYGGYSLTINGQCRVSW